VTRRSYAFDERVTKRLLKERPFVVERDS